MPEILALDLALTRTGYATAADHGVLVPPKGQERGMRRLGWIRHQVMNLVTPTDDRLVVLEGYGFTALRGHAVMELGELGGIIRFALYAAGIAYVDVAPATLKKYATGKGNAAKELVLVEAVKRLGYVGSDHNEADALWLLTMARDHYGLLAAPVVPKAHRESLGVVQWPRLNGKLAAVL